MPKKKPPPKPEIKQTMNQKERFIEYARDREADESGERFEAAMNKVAPTKK